MNSRTIYKWFGAAIAASVLALQAGCGEKGPEEILIGAPISLTGILAADGRDQQWAYQQAIDDVNKAGGIFIKDAGKKLPVKLIVADDESNSAKVADAMERLIKVEHTDLILSTHGGDLNLAGAQVAEKYKKFYMITTMWPHMWTPNKFQSSALFFFDAGGAAEVPFKVWDGLPEDQRPQRPALLMEDSPDGNGFGGAFKNFAKEHGYTFAVDEPWAVGAKDYSAHILKMKAANVDAILLFGAPADAITLVRQMKEHDLNVKYMHGWKGTWSGEFREALGDDSDYIIADGFWSMDYPYPGAKDLGERYMKAFNKGSVAVGMFYANAQVLLKAIEQTGSTDPKVVRDAVVGHEFKDTVQGDVKFDDAGLALITSTANQWWKGRHMLFYPHVDGGWELKMMPPWDQR